VTGAPAGVIAVTVDLDGTAGAVRSPVAGARERRSIA
jgi:hypothetical protein